MIKAPEVSSLTQLVEAVRGRTGRGGVIIAFADFRYVDVLMNWLVALALNRIENYLVIALDRQLYDFLRKHGVPVALSELHGDFAALWVRRIEIFAALCAAGIDFVHSDVDAVWMRDPREAYLDDRDADLVISQGTVWPPDCHQQFGFVLCCGLFMLRSTARTQQLLGELKTHVAGTGDDQVSLNRLVAKRTPQWRCKAGDTYYAEALSTKFLCSRSVIRGTGSDGMRIAVLPHHLFQRVPISVAESPFVMHLLTAKEAAAKMQSFQQHGCLFLRPDWLQIEFDAGSLSKLKRDV
jgi:hypothetical protein